MTDAVQIALIAAIPPTILAAGTLIVQWRTSVKASSERAANATAIKEVAESVDGKMEKLLEVTKSASHAEGVKEEVDKQATLVPAVTLPEIVKVKLVEESK